MALVRILTGRLSKIKVEETVMHGIDQAPDAFLGLFSGGDIGKMLIKL